MKKNNYRIDSDTLGQYKIVENALYGSQTKRSFDALHVTNRKMSKDFIKSILVLKKSIIKAHYDNKKVQKEIAEASIEACDDILNDFKSYSRYFITDQIQGGAGTSVNMNVNEVVANLATLKLGGKTGEYKVHPNDIINIGQSTNDIFPSAGKMVFYKYTKKLIKKISILQKELRICSERFNIIRVGKTHLQDAVPMNMKSIFTSWASALGRDIKKLTFLSKSYLSLNIGGTAVGTGISEEPQIVKNIYEEIYKNTKIKFSKANDLVDATRNIEIFLDSSNILKTFMTVMSKNCNDLRMLASGPSSGFGEIIIPEIQPGSSIMPGKVNPIIPETINQIFFLVIGQNATINYAVEAGQLELNVFEPIIFSTLLESYKVSIRACELLVAKVLNKIKPNELKIKKNLDYSSAFATIFAKKFGYSIVGKIVRNAILENKSVKNALIKELNITKEEYENIVNDKENLFPLEEAKNE